MSDPYPTESELERIATWTGPLDELFTFMQSLWWQPEWGWREPSPGRYNFSTGGWSGNEDLIGALSKNNLAWAFTWEQSRRGGHYVFSVPEHLRGEALLPEKP